MGQRNSHLLHNLINKGLAAPPVDTGIRRFGREAVEDIDYSVLAKGLVASSVDEPNNRRLPKQIDPYELMLSGEVDPIDAAKWMGKVLVKDYGSDFAVLRMFRAASSNRATDNAVKELGYSAKRGVFGFVFLVEQGDLTDVQEERARQVRDRLHQLALPTMRLIPSTFTEAELGIETAENQFTVGPQFTIDQRLEYPLILRRTIEPSAELSLVETA